MVRREKNSFFFVGCQRKMYHVGTHLSEKSGFFNHRSFLRPSHGGFFKTHGRPHFSVPGIPHTSNYGESHKNHKVISYIFHSEGLNTLDHVGPFNLSHGCGDPERNRHGQNRGGNIHNHVNHRKTSGDHGFLNHHSKLFINEKETMQLLNDRLSSYLWQIQSLEEENAQLEKMINEWHESYTPIMPTDQSQYLSDTQELQNQMSSIISENAGIVQQNDNAKIAHDDFNNKYEMEHNLRSKIDADITALRHIWEGCKEETGKLESEVESLEQELLRMRRDSEQEINYLTTQLGLRVSVEVEAARSEDLTRALSDIREQYEKLLESNQREAENRFTQMAKKLDRVDFTESAELSSLQSKMIDLKFFIQIMEIELQREQNMISILQDIVAEKKAYYSSDLSLMQDAVNIVKDELQQIQSRLQSLSETNKLLSKDNVQHDITTYQQLLEEHITPMTESPPSSENIGETQNVVEEHPDVKNTGPV